VKDPISATLSFLQILVSITLLIRVIRFSSLFILSLRKNLLLFALSYYISYTTSRRPRVFLIPSPIEFGASDFTKTFASSYIYIYIYIHTHTRPCSERIKPYDVKVSYNIKILFTWALYKSLCPFSLKASLENVNGPIDFSHGIRIISFLRWCAFSYCCCPRAWPLVVTRRLGKTGWRVIPFS
jgi:hypothetical protein